MKFRIGFGTRNALNDGEAAYRQTQAEHDNLLHKYERAGMTPAERMIAEEQGIIEEKLYPKYWDDEFPRRDVGGSSSWIDEIEYLPSFGLAIMHTKGNQYYYPMTSDEVGDWMNSDYLGSYYNNFLKQKRG